MKGTAPKLGRVHREEYNGKGSSVYKEAEQGDDGFKHGGMPKHHAHHAHHAKHKKHGGMAHHEGHEGHEMHKKHGGMAHHAKHKKHGGVAHHAEHGMHAEHEMHKAHGGEAHHMKPKKHVEHMHGEHAAHHAGRKPRKSGGGVLSSAASGTPRGKASHYYAHPPALVEHAGAFVPPHFHEVTDVWCMDTKRGKKPRGRIERQGAGISQS